MILPRRLRVAPLLLTLLLAAGPLTAEAVHRPRAAWQPQISVDGLWSEMWSFLNRIWVKEGGSIDPFGKAGGSIDPFGNPQPNTKEPQPSDGTSTPGQPSPGH